MDAKIKAVIDRLEQPADAAYIDLHDQLLIAVGPDMVTMGT